MQYFIDNYPILANEFAGNTIAEWIIGVLVFLAVFSGLKLFRFYGIKRLKALFAKTETDLDDIFINAIDSIYWPFYFFASVYAGLQFIQVPDVVERWSFYVFLVIAVYYAIKFLAKLIDYGGGYIMAQKEGEQDTSIIKLVTILAKVVLWTGAVVLILSNMGYNVTSLIAGLGIGGIAVGFALQKILGDLFSSLAIYLDKPFKIGDFIIVDNYMGTVKRVGIKTTRITSLQGEEVVFSNTDLTSSRVQNFGIMEKRRIVFNVGVTYDTPAEKLRQIPKMIEQAVTKQAKTEFDRSNFSAFGDSSLNFENVYYVATPDYNEYMDTQEAINLDIVEQFERAGIEIAFPTRTVYVKNT